MAIAVSILETSVPAAQNAADRVEAAADAIEFRLDALARVDPVALFAGRRKPTIAACPLAAHGGRFSGTAEEALTRLRDAARAGASCVDVDWRLADRPLELPATCRRIVSLHRDEGMPDDPNAVVRFLRSLAGTGDFVKFVPRADTLRDALELARLTAEGEGRVFAFATGPAALLSRVLAVCAGAPWVYAAPAAGSEAAPGQPPLAELRGILPPRSGSRTTAVYGVVGNPIGHSLSPLVHNIAFRMLGLDAVFLAFEPNTFEELWDGAQRLPFFRGFSVTAPFKEDALRCADLADDAVRAIVAANTLVRGESGWRALNTDDEGAADALEFGMEEKLLGKTVLVLGTGGAARAVAAGVRRRGARVVLAGRHAAKAERLARHFLAESVAWEMVADVAYDVLVHCTPVGQWPEGGRSPIDAEAIRPGSWVMDAVVRPMETELARQARARQARFLPGVNWFLFQAARQVRLFTGAEAPLVAMRAAALEALRREPKRLPGLLSVAR